jgi:hypothetical protein
MIFNCRIYHSIHIQSTSIQIAPTSVALRSSLCKIGNHLIELALVPKVDNDDKRMLMMTIFMVMKKLSVTSNVK